jgi:hypothetical protein
MSPESTNTNIDDADDWLLIQRTVGDALRLSLEEVTQEQLSGAIALLLVRIAFAEVVSGIALGEDQVVEGEVKILSEHGAA